MILDGAHNRDAGEQLVDTLADEFSPAGSRLLVLGTLSGRSPDDLLDALAALRLGRGDHDDAARRARACPRASWRAPCRGDGTWRPDVVADPAEATRRVLLVAGDDDLVVVAGSFYL